MKLLIFGAQGQVGHRLAQQCAAQQIAHVALTRSDCPFTALNPIAVEAFIFQHEPTHIINAAGFTAVDAAEEQQEQAYAVNAEGPTTIAQAAEKHGIPFAHLSTDYVFDGMGGAPYIETSETNPLSHYGKSKLLGEQGVLAANGRVFRLQWVYDTRGSNFFLSMRKLLSEREQVSVVADQLGAPSYAPHIAAALLKARDVAPGLYHLANGGFTSWHGFTCHIARGMGSTCRVAPIPSAEYPMRAPRPKDTRLDTSKLTAQGITLPHWTEGLNEALHAGH